jgi:hypothetical protein
MRAPWGVRHAPLRSAAALRRQASSLIQCAIVGLKLTAGTLAAATAALAIMNYQDRRPAPVPFEPVRNETVVYRQASLSLPIAREAEPPAYQSDTRDNYPRSVRTIRFLNPAIKIGSSAAAAREPAPDGLIKVGGFAAFPAKQAAEQTNDMPAPKPRTASVMNAVDDYLWEVYQREPVKKDRTGDFSWKDPAAAKRAGMALQDYVIGGMHPDFREQLYHAGKAMDAAGLHWSMLSAFRDDYRQKLASGFKARGGNSLHGGSRRTGGYGHGRAIDITNADGEMSDVWKWIDANGAKYGLYRPMPGNDPAHIQQKGDWQKIAATLRTSRVGVADATAARSKRDATAARATAARGKDKAAGRTKLAKASSR